MTVQDPLQERIWELRCAAHIAEQVGDLVFAKELRERAQELEIERAQRKEKDPWGRY